MRRPGRLPRHCKGEHRVTTEEALSEVLAFFCEEGQYLRQLASNTVRGLFA